MAHQTDRYTILHRKPNDVPMDATHRGSSHHVVVVPMRHGMAEEPCEISMVHVCHPWRLCCRIHRRSSAHFNALGWCTDSEILAQNTGPGDDHAKLVRMLSQQCSVPSANVVGLMVTCMRGRSGNIRWIPDANLIDLVPWRRLSLTNWLTPTCRTT